MNLAEVKVIEPASTGDLALTIDGVADEDIVAPHLVEQPGNVTILDTRWRLARQARHERSRSPHANWHDASYYPGGYLSSRSRTGR